MKTREIKIGEKYQVKFYSQIVTCRVISKSFFGLRVLVEYRTRWDYGYPIEQGYKHCWSWNFMEPFESSL